MSCLSGELERNLRCRTCVFEQQRVFLLGDILDTREETSHQRSYYVIHTEHVETRQTCAGTCNATKTIGRLYV